MLPGQGQERVPPSLRGVLTWERTLSQGAGGNVDLCHHTHLDTRVVLKWAVTSIGANADLNARFLRESRALSRISHPRIVRLLDSGFHDGYRYLVFEFIEGPHLGEYLEARGKLSWKDAMAIVMEMADGLAEIHRQGILHRDIKPSNTVMHETRGAVLIDFGLVKTDKDATAVTAPDAPLGTPLYVAPEIILGHEVGPGADIYSLGVVLHHLLAGSVPFSRRTVLETLEAHVGEMPPAIPGLPAPIASLLAACLAKDPGDRPRDGVELLLAGRRALEEMVDFDPTRPLDPHAVRARVRAAEAPDATVKLGVVRLPRPSRIWHGLSHHVWIGLLSLGLFLAGCLWWRTQRHDAGQDPARAAEQAAAERLVVELRELTQRGELEVASRELAYRRPLSAASSRFLEDVDEWLRKSRDPVVRVLESRTVPVSVRWELFGLLAPLEGLERAPTDGPARKLDVGALRNRFIVTRVTPVSEGTQPADGELILGRFEGGDNMLLYPGVDKKLLERDMHNLVNEERDLQEKFIVELEWSGIPRARRIRIYTRCQAPGYALDLSLGPGRRVLVWGRGTTVDMGKIGDLDGWIAGETPALQHQVVEVALPPDALEPGLHSLTVAAHTLAPPIPGQIDCIPAVPWIALDR